MPAGSCSPRLPAAPGRRCRQADLIESGRDLPANVVGDRCLRPPRRQDLLEIFALLIIGQRGRNVRADLAFAAGRALDPFDEIVTHEAVCCCPVAVSGPSGAFGRDARLHHVGEGRQREIQVGRPYERAAAGGFEVGDILSAAMVKPITAPPPGRGAAFTVPPWSAATSRTIDNPNPDPGSARAVDDR